MLELPKNFKNDIQSKDTNLVPVIRIGNYTGTEQGYIFLSTGIYDIRGGSGNPMTHLPLLLNIPSLTESINISTRKYSINSVNIDISNYEYNGKRFSELISESYDSLINIECRIYWVSPTGNRLWTSTDPSQTSAAMQIYFGTIRRYDHDTEKVKLVIEDRSQQTLHKDLPTAELGFGDDVPDKYKGKKIPIVVGHVDRSPCVVGEQSELGEIKIYTDDSESSTALNATYNEDGTLTNNPLIIFRDDKYYEVLSNDISAGESIISHWGYSNTEQYSIISNNNILISNSVSISSGNTEEGEPTFEILSPLSEDFVAVKITDFYEKIKLYTPNDNIAQNNGTYYYSATTIGEETLIYMVGSCGCIDDDNYNYKIQYLFPQLDKVEENYYKDDIESYISYKINFNYKTTWVVNNDGRTILFSVIGFGGGSTPSGEGILQNHSDDVDISNEEQTLTLKWVSDNEINSNYKLAAQTIRMSAPFGSADSYNGSFSVNSYERTAYILIDKFSGSDFYANVIGRATETSEDDEGNITITSHPTAPSAIAHILNNELGQDVDATGTYDWKYAFTVDKKIGSKKLLENIASASPYLPRFTNMGEFKFTEIPMDGQPVTPATVQTIKEADCISFSFSRSKIESVFTKIVFKWNWDYARKEFNDSVEADIEDILDDYKLDYYGLTDPVEMVIDGEQGKYIRDETTAQKFAEWYLLWSCNQKLKLKIKLPLSKGLNLEIGDFVDFDELLGGVETYGIDYTADGDLNGQEVFKNFLITSTNKTLEFCQIECIMMHDLYSFIAINTTFEPDIFYDVIALPELDGVFLVNLYEEFPELENLIAVVGVSEVAFYIEPGGWIGRLRSLEGGATYQIKFSQETTTNLFQLDD